MSKQSSGINPRQEQEIWDCPGDSGMVGNYGIGSPIGCDTVLRCIIISFIIPDTLSNSKYFYVAWGFLGGD